MSDKSNFPMLRRTLSWAVIFLAVLAAISVWFSLRPARPLPPTHHQPVPPEPMIVPRPGSSPLAEAPDWSRLERYQNSVRRTEFEHLLTSVFVTGDRWREWIEIGSDAVSIRHESADPSSGFSQIRFAEPGDERAPMRSWRRAKELPPAASGRPLDGLRVAIDPGHLGGPWAKMEERWLKIGDGPVVCEGDMTMIVARHLKPMLEALGATVFLVRDGSNPATIHRPESLLQLAATTLPADAPEASVRKAADRLFYRTAEIRARAELVNRNIAPDLVFALHFNAESWGDASSPQLVDRTHFHVLVNGAYTDEEIAMADQRLAMLEKLMSGTHGEEVMLATRIADRFAAITGLPSYTYDLSRRNVLPAGNHPYVWARNLLANRMYDCPVLFMEPYVMNSTIDYPRMAAGDYDGLRDFGGTPKPSIMREYASALAQAMAAAYADIRGVPSE